MFGSGENADQLPSEYVQTIAISVGISERFISAEIRFQPLFRWIETSSVDSVWLPGTVGGGVV